MARHVPASDLRDHARARTAGHYRHVDVGARGGPKESVRWIEGYQRIAEMAAQLPGTRLVYVADREADLVPLMVRAKHNRCLPDGRARCVSNCGHAR